MRLKLAPLRPTYRTLHSPPHVEGTIPFSNDFALILAILTIPASPTFAPPPQKCDPQEYLSAGGIDWDRPPHNFHSMRSFREIAFRLHQEYANLSLWLLPPKPHRPPVRSLPLPHPNAILPHLRGTPSEASLLQLAAAISGRRFPLLGIPSLELPAEIPWCRDPVHGQHTGLAYFRRVPYLDFARAGDHKLIWELNRHQHLAVLAQAALLTGNQEFVAEIETQLSHWLRENPFQCGINWTSALEVAFRALSWLWLDHWLGDRFSPAFYSRFRDSLYQHGCHLESNLSVYFSPNTHLLGEAVALHALGCLFDGEARAHRWQHRGAAVTLQEMERQVRPDGSHFEQSTYYHVYALDLFLFHALLNPEIPPAYRDKLRRMAEFLDACLPPSGNLPFLGDDDGGRMFHPYGPRPRFALGALAAAAVYFQHPPWIRSREIIPEQALWWLGAKALDLPPQPLPQSQSRLFPDSGLAVLTAGGIHALCDAGPFGALSAGHSHSDTLSLVISQDGEELLIDPGTCTYVSDPALRAAFRGSSAHNTIRINGLDQATPRNSFAWLNPPHVQLLDWRTGPDRDFLDATCRYAGFTHRRTVVFLKPDCIVVLDRIDGPPGEHEIEQFWHLPANPHPLSSQAFAIGTHASLLLSHSPQSAAGMRSRAFASREPSSVLSVKLRTALPCRLAAAICFRPAGPTPTLTLTPDGAVVLHAHQTLRLYFPESGEPALA